MKTNYFEIKLTLKQNQYTALNNWRCTVLGEERTPTCRWVVFHVEHIEDIPKSFILSEVEEVHITWKSNESY